ncbi:MAG: hypothetical protein HYV07_08675 [Deltaproteobacteria bacterium]|nr:hypothetical protein [Deltaproteobacteria bacterium]
MSSLSRGSLSSAVVLLISCGGDSFEYPLDGVLRMNHLQVKGTHNSFHVAAPEVTIDEWSVTQSSLDRQLDAEGVRQLELDLHLPDGAETLGVYHVGILDPATTCQQFTDCLAVIKRWSDKVPAHLPLVVQLQIRIDFDPATAESVLQKIESEISSVWPQPRLITPDEVKGDAATLKDAVLDVGWPKLGALRGRVIFAFDDQGPFRSVYTREDTSLDGRRIFVDAAVDAPYAAYVILNDATRDFEAIQSAVRSGFLVRTRSDSSPQEARAHGAEILEKALESGAQLISTDFPVPKPGVDFSVSIPGGTPARCNPLTAPKECTPEAIEDPELMAE